MKKFFTTLILCVFMLSCLPAEAKKDKKEEQQQTQRLEYLNLSWWEKYNDPILTSYIRELYEKNHDLKIAALKVKEGEKMVKISLANELPQITFDGNLGRTMRSSNQQFGSMLIPSYAQWGYQLPLTASYEIDIWGENRLRTKSIAQQLEIIKQEERASYIALTSAFASVYFNLIKTDKLLDIQKDIVASQEEITKKTQKYPIKEAAYTPTGELKAVIFHVSDQEGYSFDRDGKFLGHWIGDYRYTEKGRKIPWSKRKSLN